MCLCVCVIVCMVCVCMWAWECEGIGVGSYVLKQHVTYIYMALVHIKLCNACVVCVVCVVRMCEVHALCCVVRHKVLHDKVYVSCVAMNPYVRHTSRNVS